MTVDGLSREFRSRSLSPRGLRSFVGALALALLIAGPTTSSWAADAPAFLLRWGTFGSGPGQFGDVYGIGTDADGEIYVADAGLNRIQVFNRDSLLLRTIGSPGAGPGQFTSLRDVAVDRAGNVFALESPSGTAALGRIQVFDAGGQFARQWSFVLNREGRSIALSPDDSLVYATVGEYVLKFTTAGVLLAQWSYMNTNNGNFGNRGIAVGPSGTVYVASINLNLILKYSANGSLLGTISGIDTPLGVATDSNEQLYVSSAGGVTNCKQLDQNGLLLSEWGPAGTGNGEFTYPLDLAVAPNGDVFVIDEARPWIQRFGFMPTSAMRGSWGDLKARFRK